MSDQHHRGQRIIVTDGQGDRVGIQIEQEYRDFCETGTWCLRTRTRVMGKATRSVHKTGSFRELLDLGLARRKGCL